ncbi:MAG: 30S ribosomal protein S5 [Patescibacteria group bacterium]|nr:30S ribosomal protein S5 [Patescibacteria group bacterium]
MTEENKIETPEVVEEIAPETVANTEDEGEREENGSERKFFRGKEKRGSKKVEKREKPKKEFDELLLEVRRVTRVTTGGRKMSFRATILVGNKKGKVGVGVAKGNDVAGAVSKATNEAYKSLFQVPITKGETVPYPITYKYKSATVRLLPASDGTGLKAGSSIRSVLELAGYLNILSKMMASNNKLNNALATVYALANYKHRDYFSGLREVKEDASENTEKKTPKKEKKEEKSEKPVRRTRKTAEKASSTKEEKAE